MGKVNLSSPWLTYYHKINALFERDDEVHTSFDESVPEIKVFVEDSVKADALASLLPNEVEFGNVTLKVTVVPSNAEGEPSRVRLFERAFAGNPVMSYTQSDTGEGPFSFDYVVFKNEVVQFYNDDLTDVNGNCSTLYQEIAKDIFGVNGGVFFCTDTPNQ